MDNNMEKEELLEQEQPATDEQPEVVEAPVEESVIAEVAEEVGISRQGVRDLIKKAEKELADLEETLGLAERFNRLRELADSAEDVMLRENVSDELKGAITALVSAVRI